jgi:hypothetical protein
MEQTQHTLVGQDMKHRHRSKALVFTCNHDKSPYYVGRNIFLQTNSFSLKDPSINKEPSI